MQSRLAEELKLRFEPVAILFTNEKPQNALQFKEGTWGCVIAMLSASTKGRTAVFDRKTIGCSGGMAGLCLGSASEKIPGGLEYFLSTGRGEGYPEGEAYKKTPDLAKASIDKFPIADIPYTYVVFMPLSQVDADHQTPQLVCIYANPDQLSALVVLANYDRPSNDNVIMRFGSACSTICLLPYRESEQKVPRAVVGITDVTARPYVDPDILSFTMPFNMFLEMEGNIPGSFIEKQSWKKVSQRIPDPL